MDAPMRDLMQESFDLLARENVDIEHQASPVHDYAFTVFPAAKAYEGFLKKLLYELKLINRTQYTGDRFRIGKSLNPHLPKRYQYDWVFAKLATYCGGEQLPFRLWQVWKRARNQIFHYFPDRHAIVSLPEAEGLVLEITQAMEFALDGCKVFG